MKCLSFAIKDKLNISILINEFMKKCVMNFIQTTYSEWKQIDQLDRILIWIILGILVDGVAGFHVIKFIFYSVLCLIYFALYLLVPAAIVAAAHDVK